MSLTRIQINEYLENIGESALLADGFDEALIGFSQRMNEPMLAVYAYEKMVQILMDNDDLSYDDAVEYVDFNVVGAWVGEQTPIIVMPIDLIIA